MTASTSSQTRFACCGIGDANEAACVDRSRCEAYRLAAAVVLELGGGDGRLSGYLSAQMGQEPVSMICTDSGMKKLHVASPLRCVSFPEDAAYNSGVYSSSGLHQKRVPPI